MYCLGDGGVAQLLLLIVGLHGVDFQKYRRMSYADFGQQYKGLSRDFKIGHNNSRTLWNFYSGLGQKKAFLMGSTMWAHMDLEEPSASSSSGG